jgi:hypothetical protein
MGPDWLNNSQGIQHSHEHSETSSRFSLFSFTIVNNNGAIEICSRKSAREQHGAR